MAYTFHWGAIGTGLPYLLEGAGLTIFISAIAMGLALIVGLVLAALSRCPVSVRGIADLPRSGDRRLHPLRREGGLYVLNGLGVSFRSQNLYILAHQT